MPPNSFSGALAPAAFQYESSMAFITNLLKLFGLYALLKLDDERNRTANDELSEADDELLERDEFCQVCQYPIERCVCGRSKADGR